MRRLKFLLSMVLCCGLVVGGGLVACDGENTPGGEKGFDCATFCIKAVSCWEDVEADDYLGCLVQCSTVPMDCRECAEDCNQGLPCEDFNACLDSCPTCPK